MLQINPFLDCTIYSRIVVHIAQNSQYIAILVNTKAKYGKVDP